MTEKKRKSRLRWWYIPLGLIIVIAVAGIAGRGGGKGATPEARSTAPAAPASEASRPTGVPETTAVPRPSPTPPPPTPTRDPNRHPAGTFLVGSDIQPGIYRGRAGEGILESCYWARLKDLSGSIDSVIANDNAVGLFYVEVKGTDFAFETRCEVTLFAAPAQPPAQYPDAIQAGTYLVGADIRPGTYRGQAGEDILESCYWARLSDVAGGISSVIANDNAVGQFYVQVGRGDYALKTACELTRVGD